MVNVLHSFCKIWGIEVNVHKSAVLVFEKGRRTRIAGTVSIVYNNELLQNVSELTYLGVTLKSNCCFYQSQKYLADKALKVAFSLNSLFDILSLNTVEKLKLFDSMILHILCYACEIWGFHKSCDIERVHIKFLKHICQSTKKHATTLSMVNWVDFRCLLYVRSA